MANVKAQAAHGEGSVERELDQHQGGQAWEPNLLCVAPDILKRIMTIFIIPDVSTLFPSLAGCNKRCLCVLWKVSRLIRNTLPYALRQFRCEAFVLAAVKQNGLALQFASREMKADRDVVLPAVQQNGMALQFASREMIAHCDIVLAAVQQNRYAFQFASSEIQEADRKAAAEEAAWKAAEGQAWEPNLVYRIGMETLIFMSN